MINIEAYNKDWSDLEFLKWIRSEFDAIPEEKWCTGLYKDTEGRCCALGHCGAALSDWYGPVAERLDILFEAVFSLGVVKVNDTNLGEISGNTPKQRIINAIDICIEKYETESKA